MSVGLGQQDGNNNYITYQLLNSSGKIPDDRLNSTIARTSAIPTESTVSGWGFTKNAGTVTSVNNVSPVNGNVSLTIPTVVSSVSASSTNAEAVGAKLFYDTCGDIETLINAL